MTAMVVCSKCGARIPLVAYVREGTGGKCPGCGAVGCIADEKKEGSR